MNGIKNALMRKFGPLPAWAWAAIGGGALWWYRRHTSSSANQQQAPTYTGPFGANPYGITGGAVDGGAGVGSGTTGGGGGGSSPSGPGTNNDNSGQSSDSNSPSSPSQIVAPASTSAVRAAKTAGKFSLSTKAGARRENVKGASKGKAQTRTTAVVGSSHTRGETKHRLRSQPKVKPHTTPKITPISHAPARKRTRR